MRRDLVAATTRFERELLDQARRFAIAHELSLRGVMSAALAEYLAKRERTHARPEPQLHFRRGHPPSHVAARQAHLITRSPRGRPLR